MEQEALKYLNDQALAASGKRLLNTDVPVIVLQTTSGEQLASLEPYGFDRARYRGKLLTSSLADFVGYSKDHETIGEPSDGFVDTDSMSAKVFFNLGNAAAPGHGDHFAVLGLSATAAFSALKGIDGKKLTQKALAEWLEDWNDFAAAEYPAGDGNLARAIAAIRKLTINASSTATSTVNNLAASKSAFEQIEAATGNDLPLGFTFVCEPYLGLKSRAFRLMLSVLTSDAQPGLVLRWVQREAAIESIAQEFKQVLTDQLGSAAKLTIGTFTP